MPHLKARATKARAAQMITSSPLPRPGFFIEPDEDDESEAARVIGLLDPEDPAHEHILIALSRAAIAGFDPADPELISRAIAAGRKQYALVQTSPPPPTREEQLAELTRPLPPQPPRVEVVYYAGVGDRCKIGYSSNLSRRLEALNPEKLLAAEPGPMSLERQRHRQFADLRTHGEWFRLEAPLTTHIEQIRQEHGQLEVVDFRLKRARHQAS